MPSVIRLKRAIRKRDGFCCLRCGMTDAQHREQYSNRCLDVHRVVPGSEYSVEPGVCKTLCIPCHHWYHRTNLLRLLLPSAKRLPRPAALLTLTVDAELKELIGKAADKAELPMNAWIASLAANFFRRPDLAAIPRKPMGRPRKAISA